MASSPELAAPAAEDAELPGYRPLCTWAVVGLVSGVLSPVALSSPVFWSIPVFGVVASLAALLQISRAEEAVSGRGIAIAGLMLSLLFGVAGPVQDLSYRYFVRGMAREFGREWFDYILAGDLMKAHQLTFSEAMRQPLDNTLIEYYAKNPESEQAMQNWSRRDVIQLLLNASEDAEIQYHQNVVLHSDNRMDQIGDEYVMRYTEDGKEKVTYIRLSIRRKKPFDRSGRGDWNLFDVTQSPVSSG